jgi:hypothetical protein
MLACCLLLISVALPLQAWAVDTDGDGYKAAQSENHNRHRRGEIYRALRSK